MFKLIEEPESLWKEVANKQGVKVYSKNIPNSPAILLRAWGYLKNISVEQAFEAVRNPKKRAEWDKVLHNFKVIEDDPETNSMIIYFVYVTPMGISNRDFVERVKFKTDLKKT